MITELTNPFNDLIQWILSMILNKSVLDPAVSCSTCTFQVVWRKSSNSYPLTIGDVTYTDDPRFKVAHVPEREEWNLRIEVCLCGQY